jgi:hypothetical protein
VSHTAEWLTLAALGAYHGLNPGMGWLFAVSQGMQQGERRAVTRSFLPIAIGHEASVVVVAALVLGLGVIADPGVLHVGAAATLIGFGVFRFVRPRWHPRWTTMRVNRRELTLWSFLMSTAHGAGVMVAPVLIGLQGVAQASATARAGDREDVGMLAHVPLLPSDIGIALHVLAMVVVMGAIAFVVYEKVGLEVLRRAWVNTDRIWAGAFIAAAAFTLFTS